MKRILYIISVISLLLNASFADATAKKNQAVFDMMLSMAKNAPMAEDLDTGKCLGLSPAQMRQFLERAMRACFEKYKSKTHSDFVVEMEACVEPAVQKESGLSKEQMAGCDSSENQADYALDRLDQKIDALASSLEVLYDRGASQQEIAKIEDEISKLEHQHFALEDSLVDEFTESGGVEFDKQKVHQIRQNLSQASEKTLSLITLPVYKNSQVMMHLVDGMELRGMEKTLPAVRFFSTDSAEDILAFYRKSLPKYTYKHLGNGEHLFMEVMPKNFDMIRDIQFYASTPHVLIKPAGKGLAPQGSVSNIEIAYRADP